MKTPIQQAIQYFQENLNGLRINTSEVRKPSDKNVAAEATLIKVIEDLKKLLPAEKESIKSVAMHWHKIGYNDGDNSESWGTIDAQIHFDFDNYFKEQFEK